MAMTKDELLALIDQAAAEGWTELDLAGQELTELPEEIGKLTQLETLILGKVNISEEYHQNIQVGFKRSSENFGIFGNDLSTLPNSIENLVGLRHLDLSGNPIKE